MMKSATLHSLALPALLALAFLCGCASRETITIEVSDARTGAPIIDAAVTSRPLAFMIPTYPYPTIQDGGEAARAVTDAVGRASFDAQVDGPSSLVIVAPGYAPYRAVLEPSARSETGWLLDETAYPGGTELDTVDVRVIRP